jgi:hypothetical protein
LKAISADCHTKNSFLQKCAEISSLALGKPCSLDARKVQPEKDSTATNNMLVMFCETASKVKGACDDHVEKVLSKVGSGRDDKPPTPKSGLKPTAK